MISIIAFPRGNSYTECFYPALERCGVKVRTGVFAGRWLWENLRGIDYVHLHWPSHLYGDRRRRKALRFFSLFVFLLALARWRGTRLIWTVHNLYPHEACVIPQLDRLGRWLLVRQAAYFFVHGPSAAQEVVRRFPKTAGRMVEIEHGHWHGYYPNTVGRAEARRALGLADEEYVFLFIGLCKPYKNLEGLLQAFEQMPPGATLVIAGKFQDPAYQAAIRRRLERVRGRVILQAGFVPDEKIQVYLNACDAVTLPFTEILTSGSAMLTLGFGRPVIAPKRGFLKDIVTEGCGILYEPQNPDGLRSAMAEAMKTAFSESRILGQALKNDWGRSARIVAGVLSPNH